MGGVSQNFSYEVLMNPQNVIIDKDGNKWVQDYYAYVANAGASLAANAVVTVSLPVEADSTFILTKMAYSADVALALQTDSSRVIPLVTVAIVDSGSGRNLQNAPVPIGCLGGHDGLPFVLPVPREFKPSSSIAVTFTNTSANVYGNVKLVLFGYKKFRY